MAMYPRPNVRQPEPQTEFEYYQQQRALSAARMLGNVLLLGLVVVAGLAAWAFWNMGW